MTSPGRVHPSPRGDVYDAAEVESNASSSVTSSSAAAAAAAVAATRFHRQTSDGRQSSNGNNGMQHGGAATASMDPDLLFERTASSTGRHTPASSATTVITPRLIRTPQQSNTPRGGAAAAAGSGGSPTVLVPFAGLLTAQEEQDAARLHQLQLRQQRRSGVNTSVDEESAPGSVSDGGGGSVNIGAAKVVAIDDTTDEQLRLGPQVTDFASRDELLNNIMWAEEVRKDDCANAAAASRALLSKLRDIAESIRYQEQQLGSSVSPSSPTSDRVDGAVRTSGGVVMITALESHTRQTLERELKTLSKRLRELKEANLQKEVRIAVATRKLGAVKKRTSVLQQVRSQIDSLADTLESLRATAQKRIDYLQSALSRVDNECRVQQNRAASERRFRSTLGVTAEDLRLKQVAVEEFQRELEFLRGVLASRRGELAELQAANKRDEAAAATAAAAAEEEKRRQRARSESPRTGRHASMSKEAMERDRAAKHDLAKLREHLTRLRREQLDLVKRRLKFGPGGALASSTAAAAAAKHGKKGSSGAQDDPNFELLQQTMALLKATVINFGTDLRKLQSVQQQPEDRQELLFKTAHNEIKVALSLCLPPDQAKRFNASRDEWPITPQIIRASFPLHKLEQAHVALQDMAITWDALPLEAKRRLMTARDVIANAAIIHELALHVEQSRFAKWSAKVAGSASPGGGGGAGSGASAVAAAGISATGGFGLSGASAGREGSAQPIDKYQSFRRSQSLGSATGASAPTSAPSLTYVPGVVVEAAGSGAPALLRVQSNLTAALSLGSRGGSSSPRQSAEMTGGGAGGSFHFPPRTISDPVFGAAVAEEPGTAAFSSFGSLPGSFAMNHPFNRSSPTAPVMNRLNLAATKPQ